MCSLGALTAAYLSVEGVDDHDAVLAAHAHVGAAGQLAAHRSNGPGSFAVAWLDALAEVDDARIAELVSVEEA